MDASEHSPQSKRHSYPVILTYTETLSVLSENQREYNRKESIKRNKTPVLNQNGSDEERREKLQQALDWLTQELKDMYHQDKFLLRQFNHLNRSIQELKDKREIKEEPETKPTQTNREKQEARQNPKAKLQVPTIEEVKPAEQKNTSGPVVRGEFKLEDLKQAQIREAQKRQAESKLQEELSKQKHELKVPKKNKKNHESSKQKTQDNKVKQQEESKLEKRSLNSEYDSDYGSDQSVDKYEVDCLQPPKNIAISKSPKASPKPQRNKRWSWWK
ncbi:vicilin-like seed storage protein At2g18540 [Dendronephthya gigantea]|uniref:vicilin-like seed storage protein At2g18540 n=1 Tax=Dendronephthya gigantea TaxID=151771 RepID=UPI00106BCFDE|nr:vicilin-like seed storage protein At2g18540 [Dendronephthya gigantea]